MNTSTEKDIEVLNSLMEPHTLHTTENLPFYHTVGKAILFGDSWKGDLDMVQTDFTNAE